MIKYLAFYDNQINSGQNRYVAASCQSKLEYVADVLCRGGEKVEIVSPSCTKNASGYYRAKKYNVNDKVTVSLPATRGYRSIFGKVIRRIRQYFATNGFVYRAVKRGDTVIAYHSLALVKVLKRLKKKKNITLIMHVEEIYSDVSGNARDLKKEESVFSVADGYIFPTEMLNEVVNKKGRPFAIAHGDYKSVPAVTEKYDDGKVHCVYAGTFDRTKGGCEIAINAARYLDENYCLHVIGFGNKEETRYVEELIVKISESSDCKVLYDGEKRGEQFKEYVQKCHIGLSTQNPNAVYNNSSFPSKVLTYLANGLAVVSVKIPVLERSKVNDLVTYYEGSDPSRVAEAIKQCAASGAGRNYAEALEKLDREFFDDMRNLIKAVLAGSEGVQNGR